MIPVYGAASAVSETVSYGGLSRCRQQASINNKFIDCGEGAYGFAPPCSIIDS